MTTATALTDAELLSGLDSASIATEFARITGDRDTLSAAQTLTLALTREAVDRGFILHAANCQVGDEVQNGYGDTGTVTKVPTCTTTLVEVRWDAPTPHRGRFATAHLLTGALRHRR